MDLSNDLISKFVKITNDTDKQKSKEGTVYGTAVKYNGGIYVKIDGSDLLTPVDTTADIEDGERVTITIKDHNATVTGNITSPSANEGTVTKKVTEAVDGIEDKVITEVETLVADRVSTKELDAEVARIDELIAGKATIEDLTATNATIENLKAKDAEIENLVATKATIGDLTATNATIGTLDAKVANIDTLVNGNLTSDNILSFNITSKNTTMEDAFIKDAMIDRITANKIMSGVIDTNNVVIQSTDGSMLLQGNILQMKDESGKVRIQIGKDTGGNFTFVLYDESGKGVLIDEEGIKSSDAIADGLIVDAKVADNAKISGAKLDIASVITEVNKDNSTTIKSSKIYLNEQEQSLEVAFNSLKTQVETIQDVTIDGDLSSIVEQVQSNTTQIEVNKEGINTLVAENVIRTEEISDLEGEIKSVNSTLSSKYSSLEQDISGFKLTVADTYTSKTEFDALNIGSTNLVTGTKDFSGWGYNSDYMSKTNEASIDSRFTGISISYSLSTATVDYCDLVKANSVRVEPDTEYTLSFWAKGSGKFYTYLYGLSGGTVAYHHNSSGYSGTQTDGSSRHTLSSNDTYKRYWVVYKTNSTAKGTAHLITARGAKNLQTDLNMVIYGVKVEKGNKPTDWSPAPEDVDASISSVDSKVETTNSKVAAIETNLSGITQRVSSTESTTSTLTTKVDTAQSTADSAVSSFNNLAIGGTNLYPNSNFITQPNHSEFTPADLRATYASSVDDGNVVAKYGGNVLQLYANKAGDNYYTLSPQVILEPNTTYTLSYDYASAGAISANSSYIYLWGTYGDLSTRAIISAGVSSQTAKVRKRYKITFTTADKVIMQMRFGFQNTSAAWLAVEGIKLEKGNKATDWSPSVNDVESRIDTAQSTADTANTQATANKNNISTLTTRVSTAESKLTKDSLTTTIGSYYTTSTDVNGIVTSKGYATTSQVEQTATALTATFKESGGYNLIKNSTGYGGTSGWIASTEGQISYASHAPGRTTGNNRFMYLANPSLYTNEFYAFSPRFPLKCGKKYTFSGWFYMNPNVKSYDIFILTSHSLDADSTSTAYDYIHHSGAKNNTGWEFLSITFTTHSDVKSGIVRIDHNGYNENGTTTNCNVHWSSLMLNEGSVALPWSPHPSEVYDGITTIDKDGIKVSQSNYNGYTQMKADGFYVNNGTENVISCNSSGLVVKGNVTATSGKIANFTISGNDLVGSNVGMGGASGTNQAFWAGSNTSASAPFKVGHDGALTATKATITGTINATSGTFAGTIETTTIMRAYNAVYVGSEVWGGFKKDANGNYSSAQTFTVHGSNALQIDGNPTRISSVTGEVKIGDASSYDNLRAREIYAQEIIYTNDLRTRDAAQLSLSNVSMRSENAFIEFSSGTGVIRVPDATHLYLQTGGGAANTNSEVRCTAYKNGSIYVNLRAHNLCAQNAVYAAGVNVSSDRARKRDIELYSTDALHEVCTTPVYTYHLDTDKDEELKRIGIIMQEAPLDAIDLTGQGVDLYQMVTMLWRAVQQQQEMIKELKGE